MRPGRSGWGDGWAVYDRLNGTVKGQGRLPDTITAPGGLNGWQIGMLLRQQGPGVPTGGFPNIGGMMGGPMQPFGGIPMGGPIGGPLWQQMMEDQQGPAYQAWRRRHSGPPITFEDVP